MLRSGGHLIWIINAFSSTIQKRFSTINWNKWLLAYLCTYYYTGTCFIFTYLESHNISSPYCNILNALSYTYNMLQFGALLPCNSKILAWNKLFPTFVMWHWSSIQSNSSHVTHKRTPWNKDCVSEHHAIWRGHGSRVQHCWNPVI